MVRLQCRYRVRIKFKMGDCTVPRPFKVSGSRKPEVRKLEDVLRIMDEVSKIQAEMYNNVTDSMKNLKVQSKNNTTGMCELAIRVESCADKLNRITKENKFLKIKTATLECKLEEYGRNVKSNSIEIHGVPEARNESLQQLMSILKKLGSKLNVNVNDWMIDYCYRIKTVPGIRRPAPIIVRFVRFMDKEEILAKKRANEKLSSLDIGFSSDHQIDMSEALTPEWRNIFE
ncbi:hypothetical protein J6590_062154 [Homalodisca vitripennis]|nr:hypothetical protein J6590_062154 [Homalodisca vitripennis]